MTGSDRLDSGGKHEGSDERWPVSLRGVTESIVTTLGPNDRWNAAALGLEASSPDPEASGGSTDASTAPLVIARTWGRTRTRHNFVECGTGYVQFVTDPVVFARAAISIHEQAEPVLDAAAAWVRVRVERIDSGSAGETEWIDWELTPEKARVRRRVVPTLNRGHGAVIEATVAASRLGVPGYDDTTLRERLSHLGAVVDRCGGPRERKAMALIESESNGWGE